ncbi:uridine kinase [Prochlorococcus marinus]|uniref:uridine kinase n=1 Tax=Prochlorococcus marinus TaxID=1219 RepID=UPI0022B2CDC0|nr:uridine kinase [Prochlorococcus marinus]
MIDKGINSDFNDIFPKYIRDNLLFPVDTYLSFLESLSIEPSHFFHKWSDVNTQTIIDKYWKQNTKLDWKWSLTFPFFSLLENYINSVNNPIIIGFSGLPGSGKSTLGFWIDSVARELSLDIKVISLDDFYLPGQEMDIAMKGNPWNVPRGFPGSHSLGLLHQSLDTFLKTGVLSSPTFDKSLRDGKGDRSGWCELKPKVLILEGWFVGCDPVSNLFEMNDLDDYKFNLSLTQPEKDYRILIQESLLDYRKIWSKLHKLWHLKSSNFDNTILWKSQQENEMIKLKGSGLKGKHLSDFIRMVQTAIPQQSLSFINSDTTVQINEYRRIEKLKTSKYNF